MIGHSDSGATPEVARIAVRRAPREVTLGEGAWIAAAPCALVIVVAMIGLGPPLGHRFLGPGPDRFFPGYPVIPEPVEHARYGIALLGPVLLSAVIVVLAGRRLRLAPTTVRILTQSSMLALALYVPFVAVTYFKSAGDRMHRLSPAGIFSSAWFFSLAMLVVTVARGLAARGWRRPTLVELTVLFGFGLSLNAIPQIPFPWSQVTRLQEPPRIALLADPTAAEHALARHVRRGEHVAILIQLGNRVAYDLGLVNISPYPTGEQIATRQMMRNVIDTTRAAHVHKIFVDTVSISPPQLAMLNRAGFRERGDGLLMDTPH